MTRVRTTTLGEILRGELTNGLSPSSTGSTAARVLTLSAITGANFRPTRSRDAFFDGKPRDDQYAREGRFLICRGNGNLSLVGAGVIVPPGVEGLVVPDTVISAMPDTSKVDPSYLQHVWRTSPVRRQIEAAARTTNGAHKINQKGLSAISLRLPPLAEQKRIAGILDAADALRAKRRESLAQLDTLLQATFLDMFGDPVTNPMGWEMGVVGDLLESATYGTSRKANLDRGRYPILRMNNITYSGAWDFTSLKYVDLEERDVPKHLVHRGDIVFNRTNSKALVGKTAVFREDEPMAFAGYLVRGVVKDVADPEYLGAFMNTAQMKTFLQSTCKSIVGMANINAREFQAIPMPIPPLDLQRRFAAIVDAVERQKASQRAHLAELDTLFASLQSRAFRGDL